MSLKLVPFESLDAVCEIFSVKERRDLETRLRVIQGH